MKLSPLKFGLELGIALSISFLICNIFFAIVGKEFSLDIVNTLFHNMDFRPLMIANGFEIGKLICGIIVVFIEGFFTGIVTGSIYNSLNKKSHVA